MTIYIPVCSQQSLVTKQGRLPRDYIFNNFSCTLHNSACIWSIVFSLLCCGTKWEVQNAPCHQQWSCRRGGSQDAVILSVELWEWGESALRDVRDGKCRPRSRYSPGVSLTNKPCSRRGGSIRMKWSRLFFFIKKLKSNNYFYTLWFYGQF